MTMPRSTKIVATLGPASSDPLVLERMLAAGVDVVRFNFSHGTPEDHLKRAQLVREASARIGVDVAIMADLQGPKVRVGKFEGGRVTLTPGTRFVLDAQLELGTTERCGLDYKDLPKDVKAGDTLLLNDGLIVLDVERVAATEIHTIVRIGGELSNNKGINKQGGGLSAPALTGKDVRDIETAMQCGADFVAVSFVKNRTDVEMARQLATIAGEKHGIRPLIIAKIERAEAIPLLREIIDAADGIMVARGDLAVEVGNAAVPALQKRMIKMAREANKVAITATQMMESMIINAVPTRAEVSDVANAVLDGTDAVMLSAETAAGKYPVEVVETMASIVAEADRSEPVDRLRRAVHRVSPALRGNLLPHGIGFDDAVDEPPRRRHPDLRADGEPCHGAPPRAVPQRPSAALPDAGRPRRLARRGREAAARQGRRAARRPHRADRRRADGAGGRHQCAEDRACRRARLTALGSEDAPCPEVLLTGARPAGHALLA
jgi:pyruvate kinase